jgi:eukaryotic-like serine/threonine-protein kinase
VGNWVATTPLEPSKDERFEVIRELGTRKPPLFAARMTTGGRLVVVERIARSTFGEVPIEPLVASPRILASVQHTNLARVRDFHVGREVITIVTDYIDGQLWSEMVGVGAKMPPSIALRLVADLCTALTVLRATRGPGGEVMPAAHGEVVGSNIVVSLDGNVRLLHACRIRPPAKGEAIDLQSFPLPSDYASVAPEVLEGRPAEMAADVYSVGALAWEALSGSPLFAGADRDGILTELRSGGAPRARVSAEDSWAVPIVDVVARALSTDPSKRFPSAAMMGVEIRRIAGARLPNVPAVAAFVKGAVGERVVERRRKLEASGAPAKLTSPQEMSFAPKAPPLPVHVVSKTATLRPVLGIDSDVSSKPSSGEFLSESDFEPASAGSRTLLAASAVAPLAPSPPLGANTAPPLPPSPPLSANAAAQLPQGPPLAARAAARPAPAIPPVISSRIQTLASPMAAPPPPAASPEELPKPLPSSESEAEQPFTLMTAAAPTPQANSFTFSLMEPPSEQTAALISLPPARDRNRETMPSIRVIKEKRSSRRRVGIALVSAVCAAGLVIVGWGLVQRNAAEEGAAVAAAAAREPTPSVEQPHTPPAAPVQAEKSPMATGAPSEPARFSPPAPTASAASVTPAPSLSPPQVARPRAASTHRVAGPTRTTPSTVATPQATSSPSKPKYSFDPTSI